MDTGKLNLKASNLKKYFLDTGYVKFLSCPLANLIRSEHKKKIINLTDEKLLMFWA